MRKKNTMTVLRTVWVATVMAVATSCVSQTSVTPAQHLASQPKPNFQAGSHLPLPTQGNVTPAQYLASQPKPNFEPGSSLPPLTRWGWRPSSNTCVELANNWGYALDLGLGNNAAAALANSKSIESGFVALYQSNPSKYKLSAVVDRTFPAPIPSGYYCTNTNGWFVDALGHSWQYITNKSYEARVSPEGPDDYWQTATASWMAGLNAIHSKAPIAVILNGGEYGMDVAGFGRGAWVQDPRVWAATNSYTNLGPSYIDYASDRKAHQLGILTAAIRESLPDRQLYIFYNTGNEQNRYST